MAEKNSNSQRITWSETEKIIQKLSKKICSLDRNFSSISTITRGGLVPARLLADHMGIDKILVDQIKISTDSLFVDDIYDSGSTFKKIINKVDSPSNIVFVTLLARKGKKYPKQLVYGKKTNSSSYIVFPWDKLEYKRLKKYSL